MLDRRYVYRYTYVMQSFAYTIRLCVTTYTYNINLKSGMPAEVDIPAPAITTTFLARPSYTRSDNCIYACMYVYLSLLLGHIVYRTRNSLKSQTGNE